MNKYELAVIASVKLEDEARAAVIDKVKGFIDRFGGTVTAVDEWGKKKLAYEIQKMTEGYYYFIKFESDPECPNQLEQEMRIVDGVIRYLCVRDEFTQKPAENKVEEKEEVAAETEPEA